MALLELVNQGQLTLEFVVEKMCHNPAICFEIEKRGFIREGYWADMVLVNLDKPWRVSKENIRYKCGWSPFENTSFQSQVKTTIVNGELAYHDGQINENVRGKRLSFTR